MIAVDWSHTKDLTSFDGKKVRVETLKQLLSRVKKDGEESRSKIKTTVVFHSPSIILEQGCPMNLIYNITKAGVKVLLIDNKATENYRKEQGLVKTDEADARIIYELAQNGANLQPINVDDRLLQMHDCYHQYCRYQKARIAMQNMKKAHQRQYLGAGESTEDVQSTGTFNLAPDLLPYDIAIDTLEAREKSLMKTLEATAKGLPLFEMEGGESAWLVESTPYIHPPSIKGLGKRIWLGLMVTANPINFKCLSAYLRYCGLTGDVMKTHKYNRHAKMLYHMLAEEVMKQRDGKFRPIYDGCKADIVERNPDYTKGHCHNAALNRTATFLAKEIYRKCCG